MTHTTANPAPPTPALSLADVARGEIQTLAAQVEALLISASRPLPALRLAQSAGLIAQSEEPTASEANPPADEAAPEAAAPSPTQAKVKDASRASRSAKPSGPSPAEQAAACKSVEAAIAHLNEQYLATGRAFQIEKLSGGFRVMTRPQFAGLLAKFHAAQSAGKLSRPAIETLAVIAYKQPMTRAELEAIRGVSCGEVLKTLVERRLVTIKGRAEELGRPMLYGTTKQFLDHFGLAGIADLPAPADFKQIIEAKPAG